MGRARRRLTWCDYKQIGLVVGASAHAANVDLLSQFKTAGGEVNGATVMRTHLHVWPTTTVTAADKVMLGLIVTGTNQVAPSFALGVGFDNPQDSPYLDWMLADQWEARPNFNRLGSSNELAVDLRSKRKMLDLQDSLLLSAVAVTVTSALSVDIFCRTLIALP